MKKLCFIGTSHLGSVASAWHQRVAPLYPEFEPTFFAGPGTSLYQAEFLPDQIIAPAESQLEEYFKLSAHGQTTIHLKDYDCFIFQSLDHHFIGISELCQQMAIENEDEQIFFSLACLASTVDASIERSPIYSYVKHIRTHVETPIMISMTPKTSILALEKHPKEYAPYLQYAEQFQNLFKESCSRLLDYPALTIIEQPEETLATPYFTKVEYLNPYDKQNLANVTDYWHKNVKYGKVTLLKILEQVKSLKL